MDEKPTIDKKAKRVLSELEAIAFSNIGNYIIADEEGTVTGVIPKEKLSKTKLKAVSQIKSNPKGFEVKLLNKMRALELLCRYYLGASKPTGADTEDMSEILAEVFSEDEDD